MTEQNSFYTGTELVQKILMTKLIRVQDEDYQEINGELTLRNVDFSEELREDKNLMENLQSVLQGFIGLFYYVERNEKLKIRVEPSSPLYAFFPEGRVSGMTLLNLFGKGVIALENGEDGEKIVSADNLFFDSLENAEAVLWRLADTVFTYSRESYEVRIERSAHRFVRTDEVMPRMTWTYEYDHLFEKSLKEGRQTIEKSNDVYGETMKEAVIRKNRESILGRIKAMMDKIDSDAENGGENR